jgi:hypothetical protein
MPIDFFADPRQFGEDTGYSGPTLLIYQRKDTSGFTAVAKDGYEKGYACGYAQGEWESHTTGPHVFHPEKAKTPSECGLGEFKWTSKVTTDLKDRYYDVSAQVYPEWIAAFDAGYFDGWYDGRKVPRPPDVWGTGPMPPPEGGRQGMFEPTWKDPVSGIEVQTPIGARDILPTSPSGKGGAGAGAGGAAEDASGGMQQAGAGGTNVQAPSKAISDGAAVLIGAGVVAAFGIVLWSILSSRS